MRTKFNSLLEELAVYIFAVIIISWVTLLFFIPLGIPAILMYTHSLWWGLLYLPLLTLAYNEYKNRKEVVC